MGDLGKYVREFDSEIQDIYSNYRAIMDEEVKDVFQKFMSKDDVDKEDLKKKLIESADYIRKKYVCYDIHGDTFGLIGGRRRSNKHNKRRNKGKKYSRRR